MRKREVNLVAFVRRHPWWSAIILVASVWWVAAGVSLIDYCLDPYSHTPLWVGLVLWLGVPTGVAVLSWLGWEMGAGGRFEMTASHPHASSGRRHTLDAERNSLLEEQNRLLAEQNRLLASRQSPGAGACDARRRGRTG